MGLLMERTANLVLAALWSRRPWYIGVAFWMIVGLSGLGAQDPATPPASSDQPTTARNIRVGDAEGRITIAREYGPSPSNMAIMPDGQIVFFNSPIYTDEPFRPATADEVRDQLLAGPYRGFQV